MSIHSPALHQAHSPQAHGGGQGTPGLIISYCPQPNPLARGLDLTSPCWIISDWAGYVTATQSPQDLCDLIKLEAQAYGNVRRLVVGLPTLRLKPDSAPDLDSGPTISLDTLDITF